MIVLDASVVIAQLDSRDAHHELATELLRSAWNEQFVIHTITLAETLVGPIRAGRLDDARAQLDRLEIAEWTPPPGSGLRLARLRVETGLRQPDCCVIEAAEHTGAGLRTFDAALERAASARGVPVE